MLKKTLINNAIALGVCGLSAAAALIIDGADIYPVSPAMVTLLKVLLAIVSLLYVLCGFFLMPVKKLSFLSVISVAVGMIITFVICMGLGCDGLIYYLLNPIAIPLLEFDLPEFLLFPLFLLNPLFPSLLMYLGMVLRKVALKKKGNP